MKHISVKDIIVSTMEEMGVEDNSVLFPKFHRWAKEADISIGGYKNYTPRVGIFTVDGDTVKLPECVTAVYPGVFVAGSFDIETDNTLDIFELDATLNNRGLSLGLLDGTSFSMSILNNNCWCTWLHYKIIDGDLRLHCRDFDGQKVVVPYMGYPTDNEDFIRVNPNNERAIREYIKWQHSKNSRFGAREKRMERGDIQDFEREYHRLVRYARGEQAIPDTLDKDRIAVMTNSPYSGSIDFYWLNEPNNFYTLTY